MIRLISPRTLQALAVCLEKNKLQKALLDLDPSRPRAAALA
jgi:hypothetical protein